MDSIHVGKMTKFIVSKKNFLIYNMDVNPSTIYMKRKDFSWDTVDKKLHQLDGEMPEHFGFVPWRHHVEIITKCSDINEAIFYLRKTLQEGWSRNALLNAIGADLY